MIVKIIDTPLPIKNAIKTIVKTKTNKQNYSKEKTILFIEKDSMSAHLKIGDLLLLNLKTTSINQNKNPNEFNYSQYLLNNKINKQAFIKSAEWNLVGYQLSFSRYIDRVRLYFSKILKKSTLSNENKLISLALLLGQKDELSKEIKTSFSNAGAIHILAVSGLHTGIILIILKFIFGPIRKLYLGKYIYPILILSGIWMYATLSGLSPSILRAATMFSFILIGTQMNRDVNIYQSIIASAFVILIFSPISLFNIGFQLSYLAIFGIVLIQPNIYKLFHFNWIPFDYIWKITSVSIAAQITTFPLGLFYFNQFPNWFFLSNLLIIPVIGLILSLGFIYLGLQWIPLIKVVGERILNILFSWLYESTKWIDKLPFSTTKNISLTVFETISIYLCLILVYTALKRKTSKSIFLLISTLSILLISLNINTFKIINQDQLVIYNIKNDFGLDLFINKKHLFLGSKSLRDGNSNFDYSIKNHWTYKKTNFESTLNYNYNPNNNYLFRFNHKLMLILNNFIVCIPKSDYLITGDLDYLPNSYLQNCAKRNVQIIISRNTSMQVRNYIKRNYDSNLIFDISTQGAFILNK